MALSVPLSRFTSRVGGGSAFFVRPLDTPFMIRALILTLTLACGLPCMAESGQHFLRTLGSIELHDATNQVTITTSEGDDHKISVSALWTPHGALAGGGFTKPLTGDGWFIYAEDDSHIWVRWDG